MIIDNCAFLSLITLHNFTLLPPVEIVVMFPCLLLLHLKWKKFLLGSEVHQQSWLIFTIFNYSQDCLSRFLRHFRSDLTHSILQGHFWPRK